MPERAQPDALLSPMRRSQLTAVELSPNRRLYEGVGGSRRVR